MFFITEPELLRLEKLMILVPNFTPRRSGVRVCEDKELPCGLPHDELIRNTMHNVRNPAFRERLNGYLNERKELPKGRFVVMKTGYHPMQVDLKLFFKWGIEFDEQPYTVEEKGNRRVSYAEKAEIIEGIMQKYHADEADGGDSPSADGSAGGGMLMTEQNDPNGKNRGKGGGLRTGPKILRTEHSIDAAAELYLPEVKRDGEV